MATYTKIFLFIDGLGWDTAESHDFLKDIFPFRKRIKSCLGSDEAMLANIISGKGSAEHGVYYPFAYSAGKFPFSEFKYIKFLFGAGLHKKCLFNTPYARRLISKLTSKTKGYEEDFSILNIPYEKLRYLYFPKAGTALSIKTLSTDSPLGNILKHNAVKFHIDATNLPDKDKMISLKKTIVSEDVDFIFARLSGLKNFLRNNIANSCAVKDNLKLYANSISELVHIAKKENKDVEISVFSAQSTRPCTKIFDVDKAIRSGGLKLGRDYISLSEQASIRLWYNGKSNTCHAIRELLSKMPETGHFLSQDEKERFHLNANNPIFGDDIFLLNDGIQVYPNDTYQKSLQGACGYSPDLNSSDAVYLSTEHPSVEPNSVMDYFSIMTASANKA